MIAQEDTQEDTKNTRRAQYIVAGLAGTVLAGAATYKGYQHYKRIKTDAQRMRQRLFIIDGAVSRMILFLDQKKRKKVHTELTQIQDQLKTLRIRNHDFISNIKI